MSATPTAALASFVAELQYDDLPPRIRERVKDILLDTLASAIEELLAPMVPATTAHV